MSPARTGDPSLERPSSRTVGPLLLCSTGRLWQAHADSDVGCERDGVFQQTVAEWLCAAVPLTLHSWVFPILRAASSTSWRLISTLSTIASKLVAVHHVETGLLIDQAIGCGILIPDLTWDVKEIIPSGDGHHQDHRALGRERRPGSALIWRGERE
jgi:hypothetical protein